MDSVSFPRELSILKTLTTPSSVKMERQAVLPGNSLIEYHLTLVAHLTAQLEDESSSEKTRTVLLLEIRHKKGYAALKEAHSVFIRLVQTAGCTVRPSEDSGAPMRGRCI